MQTEYVTQERTVSILKRVSLNDNTRVYCLTPLEAKIIDHQIANYWQHGIEVRPGDTVPVLLITLPAIFPLPASEPEPIFSVAIVRVEPFSETLPELLNVIFPIVAFELTLNVPEDVFTKLCVVEPGCRII